MNEKLYRIGGHFIYSLDNRLFDIMLIATEGPSFLEVSIVDTNTGMLKCSPVVFIKDMVKKVKNSYFLTENQMTKIVKNPKKDLIPAGGSYAELAVKIKNGKIHKTCSTRMIQIFEIDEMGILRRFISPGDPPDIRKANNIIEDFWKREKHNETKKSIH